MTLSLVRSCFYRYTANPHLAEMKADHLFHLKISTDNMNFQQEFSDVKVSLLKYMRV